MNEDLHKSVYYYHYYKEMGLDWKDAKMVA